MGSGFRTFAASEVLTSSNVQNYLMTQSVMYFASTAARDAAITSPVAGMVAFIDSNDANEGFYIYHGATGGWRKGPGWNAPWGIVASTSLTTGAATYNSTSYTNMTTLAPTLLRNRLYRINFQAMFDNISGGVIGVVRLTNTTTATVLQQGNYSVPSGQFVVPHLSVLVRPTSTTTPTIAAQIAVAVGGTTFRSYNGATNPAHLSIEDLGPNGAPA
jgi:hypothetical protein